MKIHRLLGLVPVALSISFAHNAAAAPQILAVLSTDGAVPLTCSGETCEAVLSTYCLQRHRPAPDLGTAYRPADPNAFSVVVTTAGGEQRRLAGASILTFEQARGYTAARVRLPAAVLAKAGAVRAAIEVSAEASLVPELLAGDTDPQTAAEVADATGPLRAMGARLVDDGGEVAGAARIVARIVNGLPEDPRPDAARSAETVRSATADARPGSGALDMARTAYDECVAAVDGHGAFSVRGCLEMRHDSMMRGLNDTYWNAGAGS